MAASLHVRFHIENVKTKRAKLDINLSAKVSELREKVASMVKKPNQEIELLYCGQCLKDDKVLSCYGVRPLMTVHAMIKSSGGEQNMQAEPMDRESVQQLTHTLQTTLANPAHRDMVEKMLSNPDTLENIIAATPGLASDPIALGILNDAEMLTMMADPAQVQKIIEVHPALGQAAMLVAAAVNEEVAKGGPSGGRSAGTFSMDQMSDEEDSEPSTSSGQITTNQLAAALAAAGGGNIQADASPSTPSASSSGDAATSSEAGQSAISTDFFRQAMAVASGQSMETVTQSQLQQLRDMGISDESVARRALEAAGGDIQTALELIFGGNF